ncbi:MAG: hypothetical protein VR74_17545 [Hyphomonas sp. BRH_c22]|nr:MAG: hypothetical protein VR74_17545 [Hyphomonas sp. BRH_c22]
MSKCCLHCPNKEQVHNGACYMSPTCTVGLAAEATEALRRARQEASRLLVAAALERRFDGEALADLAQRVSDFSDDEARYYEPHIWAGFGMTLTEFSERLTATACSASQKRVAKRANWRVDWWAPCVAPLYNWWRAQGWQTTVSIADSKPEDDEDSEGANSPFAEFLIRELKLLGADDLATPNGVKKLHRAVRTGSHSRPEVWYGLPQE